jgi:TRAP-type C4-dicarboxylate transport system substrate-binding protein
MKKILTATVASLALMSSVVYAENYQATNWMAPSHILNEVAFGKFVADVKAATKGAISFEVYSSGSLVPAPTTLGAIGDGVAQMGIVAASYTPSDLPLSGLINDLAFVAEDPFATAFALTEIGVTNPKMLKEYAKHDTVFLGGYSTPTYVFLCMKNLGDLSSVKGLKIRTAGTAQNEWAASLGAVPVATPMTDVYTGLERGSLDCTLSDPTNLEKGYKFWEIVKSITTLEQGTSLGATYVYNKDFWKKIGPENRRKIMDVTALGLARSQVAYAQSVSTALEGAAKRKIAINKPHPQLEEALAKFRSSLVEKAPIRTMKERGVEDPSDIVSEFLALQNKWAKLLEGVDRNDADAVAKIVHANIFAKLDDKTYGVN